MIELMDRLSNLYNAINSELNVVGSDRLAAKLDSWRIAVNDAMAMLQTMSVPPRTYLNAEQWDHITAWLALPVTASGAEVESCLKAAIRRLAELELKVSQPSDNPRENPTTDTAPSYGVPLMPPGIYDATMLTIEQRADGSIHQRLKLDDGTIIEHRLMFTKAKNP